MIKLLIHAWMLTNKTVVSDAVEIEKKKNRSRSCGQIQCSVLMSLGKDSALQDAFARTRLLCLVL